MSKLIFNGDLRLAVDLLLVWLLSVLLLTYASLPQNLQYVFV